MTEPRQTPMTTESPTSPLIGMAAANMGRNQVSAVVTARQTIANRQMHVAEGRRLHRLAEAAHHDYLDLEADLRPAIMRPKWLTSSTNLGAKALLVVSDATAGVTMLYLSGEPLWLATVTFTGVAVGTVLAGTHLGIQARRREEGEPVGFTWIALAALLGISVAFGLVRYFTVGAVFATLAVLTLMIALGSAFLAYLWHDRRADEIARAYEEYTRLLGQARAEFTHKAVTRFEAAEATLRPACSAALNAAHRQAVRKPSKVSEATGVGLAIPDMEPPTRAMVEELLVLLVGDEITKLLPKAGRETGEPEVTPAEVHLLDVHPRNHDPAAPSPSNPAEAGEGHAA